MKRKMIIAGNWKMNNKIDDALNLVRPLMSHPIDFENVEVVVAPSFTAIKSVSDLLSNSKISIAGQNLHDQANGPFTGEVAADMLADAGATWVIVGHSERRSYFNETDDLINKKLKAAIDFGSLRPILCVGETLEERESNQANQVITNQLMSQIENLTIDQFRKVTIAYEPVWAIGTGKTATAEIAESIHKLIRNIIKENVGDSLADSIAILYGGSLKPSTAKELFSMDNIDGGLIGGAALNFDDFSKIIDEALLACK
ncbi:MAG: triose-phosphate isomerase [Nitrospinota bacterium]